MFGVDERRHAPGLLGLGDDVQREGCLAGRFRTVDLGHPAAWDAPHPQRQVEGQRAGRDGDHLAPLRDVLAQFHDCALAVALGDLGHR